MAALPADDAEGPQRFRRALVSRLDEPVRRYLTHAIAEGALLGPAAELAMTGRIKVGAWLPFAATERCSARSFEWRAGVGWGRVRPLQVLDSYAGGRGHTHGRILGRMTLFEASGVDTARSAACRAALEAAVWAPTSVLADPEVEWRAESDELVVAAWPVAPERPEVRLHIDRDGAVKSAVAQRWGNAGQKEFGYIPCGCEVHAERRFGEVVVPSRVTVGWWFGTPRYAPFFRAEITGLAPYRGAQPLDQATLAPTA
jgi:hypothetical protein